MSRGTSEKTVNFYRVMAVKPGELEPKVVAQLPWSDLMRSVATWTHGQRGVVMDGETFLGEPCLVSPEYHLCLARNKGQAEWLGRLDQSQAISELDPAEQERLFELTYIAFLSYGNIVGLIRGSNSAPTARALAEWLTATQILGAGIRAAVLPCVDPDAMAEINSTTEATLAEIEVPAGSIFGSTDGLGLSQALSQLGSEYEASTYTIVLKAGRSAEDAPQRRAVHAFAVEIANLLRRSNVFVRSAKARLVITDSDVGHLRVESLDLLEQRISVRIRMSTADEAGKALTGTGAIHATLSRSAPMRAKLQRSLPEQ
jgi:hypothetical protein